MDTLPDELIVQILKDHLAPRDLATCRLISKRFKFLAENYVNLKELIINPPWRLYDLRIDLPYVSSEPVNYRNLIELPRFSLSPDSSFQILFANLKALELFVECKGLFCETHQEFRDRFLVSRSTLNALNRLDKLERLVLTFEAKGHNLPTFTMPSLKIFSLELEELDDLDKNGSRRKRPFDARPARIIRLTKVCSKIERLHLNCSRFSRRRVRLKHPGKLTYLQISELRCLDNDLFAFKNLRTLKFKLESFEPLPNHLLEALKKLKEIFLLCDYVIGDFGERDTKIREFVNGLLVQRSASQRPEVNIYFNDILLTRQIEENDQFARNRRTSTGQRNSLIEVQIEHYRSLADGRSPDCKSIIYERLTAALEDQMVNFQRDGVLNEHHFPTWFFERFQTIQLITVNEIENESRFIWFVRQCRNLIHLRFETCCLTQPILDQLPKLGEQFRCLRIVGKENGSGQDGLDYGSVFRLTQLAWLEVEMHLDLRIVPELFKERSSLEALVCEHNDLRVEFERESSESFCITYFLVRGDPSNRSKQFERKALGSEELVNEITYILRTY